MIELYKYYVVCTKFELIDTENRMVVARSMGGV